MKRAKLKASVLSEEFQICKLPVNSKIPSEIWNASFCSVSKTSDEISIVIPKKQSIMNVQSETGWRAIKILGPLDFKLTGVLASLINPLAKAGISVFAISTYETDYLFVKSENLKISLHLLSNILKLVGHES